MYKNAMHAEYNVPTKKITNFLKFLISFHLFSVHHLSHQMASSQPSLDLNLCPSGQSTEVAPVWQPTFRTSLGPITVNDSVIRSPATALGVANNMLMPRDQLMLGSRPDIVAADESQVWSIQASASSCSAAKNASRGKHKDH